MRTVVQESRAVLSSADTGSRCIGPPIDSKKSRQLAQAAQGRRRAVLIVLHHGTLDLSRGLISRQAACRPRRNSPRDREARPPSPSSYCNLEHQYRNLEHQHRRGRFGCTAGSAERSYSSEPEAHLNSKAADPFDFGPGKASRHVISLDPPALED